MIPKSEALSVTERSQKVGGSGEEILLLNQMKSHLAYMFFKNTKTVRLEMSCWSLLGRLQALGLEIRPGEHHGATWPGNSTQRCSRDHWGQRGGGQSAWSSRAEPRQQGYSLCKKGARWLPFYLVYKRWPKTEDRQCQG